MIHPQIYIGLPEQKQIMARFNRKEGDPLHILVATCEALDLHMHQVISKNRTREMSEARCIIVGLILQVNTHITLKQIGRMLNRDHTTIIYSRETFNALYKSDKSFTKKVGLVMSNV